MPIFYLNEMPYFWFLVSSFMAGLFFIKHFIQTCPQMFSDGYLTYLMRLLMFYWAGSSPIIAVLISFMIWFTLWRAFHLIVFVSATSSGLTLDEMYSAHQYSYLYTQSQTILGKYNFVNPSNKGLIKNWATFFRQAWSPKPILEDI